MDDLDVIVDHLLTIRDQNERTLNRLQRIEDNVSMVKERLGKLEKRLDKRSAAATTVSSTEKDQQLSSKSTKDPVYPAIIFQTTLEDLFVLWYTSTPIWDSPPAQLKKAPYREILIVMAYLKLSLSHQNGFIIPERPDVDVESIQYAEWTDIIYEYARSAQRILLDKLSIKNTRRIPGKASTIRRSIGAFQKNTKQHEAFLSKARACHGAGKMVDEYTPLQYQKEWKYLETSADENLKPNLQPASKKNE